MDRLVIIEKIGNGFDFELVDFTPIGEITIAVDKGNGMYEMETVGCPKYPLSQSDSSGHYVKIVQVIGDL